MPKGYSDVLIGLQYGDEGKAKVIDLLAKDYDIVARFNGGANAGHSIETDQGSISLNQVPSSIFQTHTLLYIGSGCVVNLEKLQKEVEKISAMKIEMKDRLFISDQAPVIQPHHILMDELMGGEIGTTKNGIGPAYSDKALRMEGKRLLTIKLGDLLDDPKTFFAQMKNNFIETLNKHDLPARDCELTLQHMQTALDFITPFVQRDTLWLQKKVAKGAKVLFEGAQSVMLDVTKGCVPFVTSSSTVAGAAYVGGDLSPNYHRKTIGVAKAIMSRVGFGPFASEFGGLESENYCMEEGGNSHNRDYEERTYDTTAYLQSENPFEVGIALRVLGREYGTVTRRPRRVGMLDLVQLTHAIRGNGVDLLFLTKCDLLQDFNKTKDGTIPLVTGYKLNDEKIDYVPGSNVSYRKVEPVVEKRDCFTLDTTITEWEKLPPPLLTLLTEIEKKAKCKFLGIGTGPQRDGFVLKG